MGVSRSTWDYGQKDYSIGIESPTEVGLLVALRLDFSPHISALLKRESVTRLLLSALAMVYGQAMRIL